MSSLNASLRAAEDYLQRALPLLPLRHQIIALDTLSTTQILAPLLEQLAQRLLENFASFTVADSCAAFNALQRYNKTLIQGRHIYQCTQLLLAHEQKPGGPYSDPTKADCDYCTNAIIARFAQLQEETLPGAIAFLHARPVSGLTLCQLWRLKQLETLPNDTQLLQQYCPTDSPVYLALDNQTLIPATQALLMQGQQADGSWPAHYPFNEALVTCFVYQKLTTSTSSPSQDWRLQQEQLFSALQANFRRISPALAIKSRAPLQKLQQADQHGELSMFATFFSQSLPHTTRPGLLTQLGKANVLVWLAYSLYDDLLDDEANPAYLPLANIALRQALEIYRSTSSAIFYRHVIQTFHRMDQANNWELTQCRAGVQANSITIPRLPSYRHNRIFAWRAGAHSLGPIAVVMDRGWQLRETRTKQLIKGLEHYLIARQLNDDLHDWKHDLQAGHLSHTVTALLQTTTNRGETHDLSVLIPQLEQHFWQTILQEECQHVLYHIQQSRQLLQPILQLQGLFGGFLDTIEQTAQSGLQAWSQEQEFFALYKLDHK